MPHTVLLSSEARLGTRMLPGVSFVAGQRDTVSRTEKALAIHLPPLGIALYSALGGGKRIRAVHHLGDSS